MKAHDRQLPIRCRRAVTLALIWVASLSTGSIADTRETISAPTVEQRQANPLGNLPERVTLRSGAALAPRSNVPGLIGGHNMSFDYRCRIAPNVSPTSAWAAHQGRAGIRFRTA